MCWCMKELPVCSMAVESWVVYATNVCRRDGDVLLRNNTLEDELHTRVPLLLKTKLTSILPPYMLGVWGSSLKFAFLYYSFYLSVWFTLIEKKIRLLRLTEIPWKLLWFQRNRGAPRGVIGLIFARYVPLAYKSPYPIIVYSVANCRPHISHFWANMYIPT